MLRYGSAYPASKIRFRTYMSPDTAWHAGHEKAMYVVPDVFVNFLDISAIGRVWPTAAWATALRTEGDASGRVCANNAKECSSKWMRPQLPVTEEPATCQIKKVQWHFQQGWRWSKTVDAAGSPLETYSRSLTRP